MDTLSFNNSSVVTNMEEPLQQLFYLPQGLNIFLTVVMSVIIVVTILGNLAVMIVFASSDLLQSTVNNQFLFSLALADLLVGLLVMPCAIDAVRTQTWRCGSFMKQFTGFGNFFFCISSIMHLMILSIDKYLSIIKPLKYPSIMTQRRVYVLCILLWTYSAFWALLPLMGVSSYECFIPYIGVCALKDWSVNGLNFAFAISVVSGTYGIALLVMFVVYWRIAIAIRVQTNKINLRTPQLCVDQDGGPKPLSRHKKLFRKHKGLLTLIILIVTYLICWSPFCIMLFVEIGREQKLDSSISLVGMLIGFTNSCCNPIIYWVKYESFRRAIQRMINKSVPTFKTLDSNNVKNFSQYASSSFNQTFGDSVIVKHGSRLSIFEDYKTLENK